MGWQMRVSSESQDDRSRSRRSKASPWLSLKRPAGPSRCPRRAARAAPPRGSAARISVSPTSTARTPAPAARRSCSGVGDPRLRDDRHALRDLVQQVEGAPHVDAEVAQVAVVDPDQIRPQLERAVQLARGRAPRRARRGRARAPAPCSAASSVCSSAATISSTASAPASERLVELVGVDDEVLAQQRQLAGRARHAQILQRAVEVRTLGQHRDRARAAALVGAHQLAQVGRSRAARRPRASGA